MPRLTNRDRNHATVKRLQEFGYDLKLSYAYNRPRVVTQDERRDISPRLTEAEMQIWLDGFVAATQEQSTSRRPLRPVNPLPVGPNDPAVTRYAKCSICGERTEASEDSLRKAGWLLGMEYDDCICPEHAE